MTSDKPLISATVIALNEEKDLPRCLKSLDWVDEIIVVDSGSTDATADLAQKAGAHVIQEPWRGYGAQKNFAMAHCRNDWVLNIDADEVVTPELQAEILAEIQSSQAVSGYAVARKTYYMGRWVRHGGWYPNYVTRLCRKSKARWSEPHVHEVLQIEGEVRVLQTPLLHYTFSDIADQIRTNLKYSRQGALDLRARGKKSSYLKIIFKPLGKFLETYVFKGGCLDGFVGFVIAVNAAHSMFLKYAQLKELEETSENSRH